MLKNYLLIGLPYSGKSFLGYRLSKLSNLGFIETDEIIKNYYNKSLINIINKYGEKEFLNIENKLSKSLYCNNNIISSGGSMIYNNGAINHFKKNLNAEIIYLSLSYDEFFKRIHNFETRGVINPNNLKLKDLYNERCNLANNYYDIKVDVNNKNLAINNIIEAIDFKK